MQDLKGRAVRGGFVRLCGQAVGFVIRIGSMLVLARLLEPKDFGLVAMVTAVTMLLWLLTSAGLSFAMVQRAVKAKGIEDRVGSDFISPLGTRPCFPDFFVVVEFPGESQWIEFTGHVGAGARQLDRASFRHFIRSASVGGRVHIRYRREEGVRGARAIRAS